MTEIITEKEKALAAVKNHSLAIPWITNFKCGISVCE